MAKEDDKNLQELDDMPVTDAADSADDAPTAAPAADDAAPAGADAGAPSERDRFRSRIAEDYPDLDMDDDDAYYSAANDRYDELKNYRDSTSNFRDALNLDAEQTGVFNQMIVAAGQQKDFDPVVWLVENGGLDVNAMMEDPDYAKKLGEARAKYLQQVSEGDELAKQWEENSPKSMEAIDKWCADNGVQDDAKAETLGKMADIVDGFMSGNIPVELFELAYKGVSHDQDVSDANEAGKAAGRQTKVSDKVRSLKSNAGRVAGRQTAAEASAPTDARNMFGL